MSHMTLDDDLQARLATMPMEPGELYDLLESQMFSVCSTRHLPDPTQAIRVYVQHLKDFDARALTKAIPAAVAKAERGFLPPLADVVEEARTTWSMMLGRARSRAEAVQLQRLREQAAPNAAERLARMVTETAEEMGK